eukprot:gene821-1840_t
MADAICSEVQNEVMSILAVLCGNLLLSALKFRKTSHLSAKEGQELLQGQKPMAQRISQLWGCKARMETMHISHDRKARAAKRPGRTDKSVGEGHEAAGVPECRRSRSDNGTK